MRVMVIVKATEDTEKGIPPTPEAMAAMHAYGEAVAAAGIGLIDGAGELIAGYSVWEVRDMDEALAWVKRWPNPVSERAELEIRPLFEWHPADESFAEKVL